MTVRFFDVINKAPSTRKFFDQYWASGRGLWDKRTLIFFFYVQDRFFFIALEKGGKKHKSFSPGSSSWENLIRHRSSLVDNTSIYRSLIGTIDLFVGIVVAASIIISRSIVIIVRYSVVSVDVVTTIIWPIVSSIICRYVRTFPGGLSYREQRPEDDVLRDVHYLGTFLVTPLVT